MLGGFDSGNYLTERQWATAADGTRVPISIVYRKDIVKLDGSDPLLLYGYGSYEVMNQFIKVYVDWSNEKRCAITFTIFDHVYVAFNFSAWCDMNEVRFI